MNVHKVRPNWYHYYADIMLLLFFIAPVVIVPYLWRGGIRQYIGDMGKGFREAKEDWL